MMKFALLSHVIPPSPSGQAVMLYRILGGIDPAKYYLISRDTVGSGTVDSFHLPAPHYVLSREPELNWSNFLAGRYIRRLCNILLSIVNRKKNILKVLRSEPATQALVACSGDLVDMPAAFLASRKARIPFYAYIFDDFVYQWTGTRRWFAKRVAPFIFKHAAGVIGPNEFICAEYQRRYGVISTLVRNPCDLNELVGEQPQLQWPAAKGKIRLCYAGAVYHANGDCFRTLIQAIESPTKHNIELHIFSAQPREQLEVFGIRSETVFIHGHLAYAAIHEQLRQADILFLPLVFAPAVSEVIRTSAPGKLGDYLASGRPVLAHVPADSFVAYYLKLHRCGWVVDQNDSAMMAATIEEIITRPELRTEITRNAQRRARVDFSPEIARKQLLESIKFPEHPQASVIEN
jgi:glycosyltransferase involved in cell wall biosynthesis